MNRTLRILAYAGLLLSAAMLVYCFYIEQALALEHAPAASRSRVIALFGGCVAVFIVIGLMGAHDVTQFLGNRAARFILFDGREVVAAPELDLADRFRRRGRPLKAVGILREYLNQHPGEAQVMTRIADIYEQDLRNPLAAALEYEELLKQKLNPEQWAWSAVRLSNLYVKLKKPEQAVTLLQQVEREHGKTSAAIKARKRLAELK